MRIKLGTLILGSATMAAAALAAIPAMAADATTLKVPFNFTVNGKVCPAGTYSVQRDNLASTLVLRGKDPSNTFIWIAGPSDVRKDGGAVLSFDQIGEMHALRSVRSGSLATPTLDKRLIKAEDTSSKDMPGQ
jgi:hypothetical protein